MTGSNNATTDLKRKILHQARRQFARNGYEAASLQSLIDAIGCSKGAFYHHFSSKEEVLLEIQMAAIARATSTAEAIVTGDEPVAARMMAFLRDITIRITENPELATVYLDESNHLSRANRRKVKARWQRYEEMFASLLKEGVNAGALRGDLDVWLTTKGALGLANSAYRWYRESGTQSREDVADCFATMILDGLVPR